VIGFSQIEGKLTLNGGSELGIQPDMPVINGEGLLGVVETVSKGQCDALLLTAFGVKVGGIDISRKPPERGLLSGRGSTTIAMMMFDPKAPVASGDVIVTGGLSSHIPYGLIIGRVISAEDDPDFGTRRATLDPAVNIGAVREVQVLK
jgi:rod shape-determining protein MreC